MSEVRPGEPCPETGIWFPSNNLYFYPADYIERVMKRHFNKGDIMPPTPHGEPSWAPFLEPQIVLQDFTGLSPEEIAEKLASPKDET